MTIGTLFARSFHALSAGNASIPDPYGYNPTLDSIWFVVTYILMTCGSVVILENLFIVMVFLSHKEFRILSNVFLASLCVANVLYASFGFYGSMTLDSAKDFSILTPGCLAQCLGPEFAYVASCWSLVSITVDRYLSVKYPLRYVTMQSKCKVAMVITSIWILAVMVTLSTLVPVTLYDYESVTCGGIIYEGIVSHILTLSVGITLPASLVVIIYYKIHRIAARHRNEILGRERCFRHKTSTISYVQDNKPQPSTFVTTPRKIAKSSKTFCIMCLLFLTCWIPMTASIYIALSCNTCSDILKGVFASVALATMLLTKILNPWIYVLGSKYFRSVLKKSMSRRCSRVRVEPDNSIYFNPVE